MKKSAILCFVLLAIFQISRAQVSAGYLRIGSLGQVLSSKGSVKTVVGEVYMDTAWRRANIKLYNAEQTIPDVPVKYELHANMLEVLVDREVKVLSPKLVSSMTYFDAANNPHEFINARAFLVDGVAVSGLLELICNGKISIYKQYSFWIKPGDKNPVLGIGTSDERAINENHFFYTTDNKNLVKLPKKKKILELFGDKSKEMEAFIKSNKLDLGNERQLTLLFNHYNSL